MNKKIIIGAVGILLIAVGAYFYTTTNKVQDESKPHTDAVPHATTNTQTDISMASMDHGNMDMSGLGSKEAGTRVILKNSAFKSGIQTIAFDLYGKDGDAWSDKNLKIAHEKKMHFILVSSDFSDYQHIHPEFKDKLWQVQANFKNNTTYLAYTDVDSEEVGAEVLRSSIKIGTPSSNAKVSQNNNVLSKGNIEVTVTGTDKLVTNKSAEITFTIKQAGKIIETENYLGAKGHVVALNDDPNSFIHGHPDEHPGNKEVHFAFNFKQKGNYTLFAQFQVNGKVETYPFTISVNTGDATTGNTVQDESKPHGH